MIPIILAILACVLVAIAFFFYFFFRRMLGTFGADTRKKWAKVVLIVIAVLCAVLSCLITSVVSIFFLHIVFIGLIIQLINFLIKRILGKKYDEKCTVLRKIYGSGIVPVLLTVIVMVCSYFNLHSVVATNYTVYTDKAISPDGYRVALIADVHFGVSLDSAQLSEKCEEISKRDVDIVILCGDIVDNSTTSEEMNTVFELLGGIKSKYGVFYVYGNHDRPMSMLKSEYTQQELLDAIENNGITILQDKAIEINGELVLIGREDRMEDGRESIKSLASNVDEDDFILVADHQPNQYQENSQAGVDLVLSGHTHGGQLFPINIVMNLFDINDGVYGHYQVSSNTQAIVTSGFAGWGYPVKNAAPAEYVVIDILPSNK